MDSNELPSFLNNKAVIETLTCEELATHLGPLFEPSIITILRDNEVDGEVFMLLTEQELMEKLGMKFGQAKKVMKYISGLLAAPRQHNNNYMHHSGDPSLVDLATSHRSSDGLLLTQDTDDHILASQLDRNSDHEMTSQQFQKPNSSNHPAAPSSSGSGAIPNHPQQKRFISSDDVIAVLEQTAEGRRILEKRQEDGDMLLVEQDRQLVVKQTVAELIRKSSFYPSADEKEQLADAIVATFPSSAYRDLGMRPSTQFFNRKTATGFIQERLKDARAASNTRVRAAFTKGNSNEPKNGSEGGKESKRSRAEKLTAPLPPPKFDNLDDIKAKVEWLKTHPSNAANSEKIIKYMESTFAYRRSQLSEFKSVQKFLAAYPRFIDHDFGSLFWTEFVALYPETETFEAKFEMYVEKFIKYGEKMGENIESNDEWLKALLLLLKLHPNITKIRKVSYESIEESIILFREEPFDLQGFSRKRFEEFSQPFLLCIGSKMQPLSFYLFVDQHVIPCGADIKIAFRNLFSSFFVLNTDYPPYTMPFYQFFERFVFGITKRATPILLNYVAQLKNF